MITFDETLGDMDLENIGKVGDYLTYVNGEAIITQESWNSVCNKLEEADNESKIPVLRGMFQDDLHIMGTENPIASVIKWLNYESQLRPIVLVTEREETEYRTAGLKTSVRIKKLIDAVAEIEQDEDFLTWKSIEILKIQRMIENSQKNHTIQRMAEKHKKSREPFLVG